MTHLALVTDGTPGGVTSAASASRTPVFSDVTPVWRREWLSTKQAAAYLGIGKSTLYHWVGDRKIPFVKKYGLLRFSRSDLDKWMHQDRVPCVDEY